MNTTGGVAMRYGAGEHDEALPLGYLRLMPPGHPSEIAIVNLDYRQVDASTRVYYQPLARGKAGFNATVVTVVALGDDDSKDPWARQSSVFTRTGFATACRHKGEGKLYVAGKRGNYSYEPLPLSEAVATVLESLVREHFPELGGNGASADSSHAS